MLSFDEPAPVEPEPIPEPEPAPVASQDNGNGHGKRYDDLPPAFPGDDDLPPAFPSFDEPAEPAEAEAETNPDNF